MRDSVRWVAGIAVALGTAIVTAAGGSALAGTGPKLDASFIVGSPANASPAPEAFFETVSCPTAGSCVAGGGYRDRANRFEPMVAQSVSGRWARATEVLLPSNASVLIARVMSIDCTGPGDCVAVGLDEGGRTDTRRGFVAVQAGGRWHRAFLPNPPAKSADGIPSDQFNAVNCSSAGSCTAAGWFFEGAHRIRLMAISESRGRWGRAIALPLPANASRSQPFGAINGISCPTAGNCLLGGQYTTGSGAQEGLAISLSAGRWHPTELSVPSDATKDPFAAVRSVSCPGIGNCVAVGTYSARDDDDASFALAESGGRWGQATRVTAAPANSARISHLELDSVTCAKPDTCLALGNYTTKRHGHLMMTAVESGGRWTGANEITLPGNALSTQRNNVYGASGAIACPSSGNCTAVGSYFRKFASHAIAAQAVALRKR